MTFLEFIRSKGFTIKSLAEKAGVNQRSLEVYSGSHCSEWRNAGVLFALKVADALEIPARDLLKFDGATPEPRPEIKWRKYKTKNSAYQAKRRLKGIGSPTDWSIIAAGAFWYLVRNDCREEWEREFCGGRENAVD